MVALAAVIGFHEQPKGVVEAFPAQITIFRAATVQYIYSSISGPLRVPLRVPLKSPLAGTNIIWGLALESSRFVSTLGAASAPQPDGEGMRVLGSS